MLQTQRALRAEAPDGQIDTHTAQSDHRVQVKAGPPGGRGLIVEVQLLSRVPLLATPWTAACQASPSFTISRSLLQFTSIESMMPSNRLTSNPQL